MRKFSIALLCAVLLPSVFAAPPAKKGPASVQPNVNSGVMQTNQVSAAVDPKESPGAIRPKPLVWQNTTALRYNPLGLFNETRFGYRYWLYDASQKPLLKGSNLGASAVLFTSPALVQAGADLEASPLAIQPDPWLSRSGLLRRVRHAAGVRLSGHRLERQAAQRPVGARTELLR